ncbi:probable G-protein coupled receptor 142 [Phyllostomus hastatus]|uniref:probable G-protein coupled receptor 142 n=1 Tax=Phyllostomus hastatus TaxID=9423 RepID=UPI001E67F8AD|nr:probable G-protein coupled receptor 142 [Phyllostomus hastatus]
MRLEGQETAGQPRVTMLPTPNGSGPSQELGGHWPETPERSPCVAGVVPVVYYSILLGLGLPGFLLQGAVLAREVPRAAVRTANVLEFAANHASVWIAVLLAVDRYRALCHPLCHRAAASSGRTRRDIAVVLGAALLTGIPFYWWLDVWRDAGPPGPLDKVLKWAHCLTVYFIPCGVFLVTNVAVVCRLRRRGRSGPPPRVGKSTAILLGLTALFTFLWAPRVSVMLYHLYVAPVHQDWRVHLAFDVANMVAMLNTVVNFGLCCFVSKTFRATVRGVLHDAHLPCGVWSQPRGPGVQPVLKPPGLPKGAGL